MSGKRQPISGGQYEIKIKQKEKENLLDVPETSNFVSGEINTDMYLQDISGSWFISFPKDVNTFKKAT